MKMSGKISRIMVAVYGCCRPAADRRRWKVKSRPHNHCTAGTSACSVCVHTWTDGAIVRARCCGYANAVAERLISRV